MRVDLDQVVVWVVVVLGVIAMQWKSPKFSVSIDAEGHEGEQSRYAGHKGAVERLAISDFTVAAPASYFRCRLFR